MTGSVQQRELRALDLLAVREQLGREPSVAFAVIARCTGGHPLVIRNAPIDDRGDPFPTTFWLTCPETVKAVARIESEGWIASLNERVQDDEAFDEALERAHQAYADERAEDHAPAGAWGGVAGTRTGIKCLHAHYAYHLAGGDDPVGAWVAERVEPVHDEHPGRVAAIDQGTNSIRLLVMEPGAGAAPPTEIARDMVITRLGRGVDQTGRLDPDALARTIDVLARFCRRARHLGAERIRVGATSAVRDASNRDAFVDAVLEHADGLPEVLAGEREAELSFLGATHGLDASDAPGPLLLFDIGGGSTEYIVGDHGGRVEGAVTTQMGSVRLTERWVTTDPPTPDALARMTEDIDRLLDEVEGAVPAASAASTLLAVAGTATTLQALALDLARYDPDLIHRSWLLLADAERLLADLVAMTNSERAALPVMAPGRGDVMVAGTLIFVRTLRRFGFDRALVSESDILDGLALEMLDIR